MLLVLFQPSSLSELLVTLLIHDRHEKVHERKYKDQQVQPHNQTHVERKIPLVWQHPSEPFRFIHIGNVHKHNHSFDNKPHRIQDYPQRIP